MKLRHPLRPPPGWLLLWALFASLALLVEALTNDEPWGWRLLVALLLGASCWAWDRFG